MQKVNEELAIKHGLTAEEYNKIIKLMGRNPNLVELGIFSAMWNEHCSYKSSRIWLQTLPTKNKFIIVLLSMSLIGKFLKTGFPIFIFKPE